MSVSIIIPAYNEAAMIADVVRSARDAAKAIDDEVEIIVVNDASSDDTAAIAEAAGAKVVHANNRQISKTRNDGARAARGDYFIFLDGDTLLPEQTLVSAVHALEDGAAGGGGFVLFDDDVQWYWRALLPMVRGTIRLIRASPGCFLFCTRKAFDATGGFSELVFAGEEIWFSHAVGRYGRFEILRESVVTSGRKARMYTPFRLFGTLFHMALMPWRARGRKGLGIWYDGTREEQGGKQRAETQKAEMGTGRVSEGL